MVSCKGFTPVDVQGLAGKKRVCHCEEHAFGDVHGRADPPRRVAGTYPGEIVLLRVLTKCVPGPGVDNTGRDGVNANGG
jgi:hypothetical protein